ncbi:MAG: hypothetical protein JXR05_11400 [Flavobacteriaceae bacterium]
MSKSKQIDFNSLSLDLSNLRMMPQKSEQDAIHVMIAIKPERFFGVIDSIINDGYLRTENIIVLKKEGKYIVKEGNRRVAALKLIHGIMNIDDFGIPDSIKTKVIALTPDWKKNNRVIPCLVYEEKEIEVVNRIVSLTHGKGEKASRDPWSSVARARHNRDEKGGKEFGLDFLEKYLKKGKNLTAQQKERWSGDYNITVLDEALKSLVPKCGFETTIDLIKKYPKVKHWEKLEDIMRDIGLENLSFKIIRDKEKDFMEFYGFPKKLHGNSTNESNSESTTEDDNSTNSSENSSGIPSTNNEDSNDRPPTTPKASATNTARHVKATLKKFNPTGNRPKVVTLKNELLSLNIKNNPIAFCFILRSMFEISAKAYCRDYTLNTKQKNGKDKSLSNILTIVTNHLTDGNKNKGMVKTLHGALTEITNPNRILSVTSMNQLVHSENFSVQQSDICTLFSNIYPLLEAMN